MNYILAPQRARLSTTGMVPNCYKQSSRDIQYQLVVKAVNHFAQTRARNGLGVSFVQIGLDA